jgi:L-cystine uptake protein TcyP (sodium:dicarboxylate symporter family)
LLAWYTKTYLRYIIWSTIFCLIGIILLWFLHRTQQKQKKTAHNIIISLLDGILFVIYQRTATNPESANILKESMKITNPLTQYHKLLPLTANTWYKEETTAMVEATKTITHAKIRIVITTLVRIIGWVFFLPWLIMSIRWLLSQYAPTLLSQ